MLQFSIALDVPADLTPPPPERRRTPQCYECNRFCRILSEYYGYDGQGTQLYVTYDCTHCGVYTQGIW